MNKVEGRIYIIGAGFAGQMIAGDIAKKKIFGTVAAFLDDDKSLIGTKIDDIPVLGPIDSIADILRADGKDQAVIAVPSAPVERIREIYSSLKKCGFSSIKILPSISQVIDEKAHIIQARDINPLDILGRTPVTIPLKKSLSYLKGRRVLITGAGGSIGSELSRQLLSGGAERLYLFGHGENSIVNIYRELHTLQDEGVGEKATIVPIIGDMRDKSYVSHIMKKTRADAVFHCAAYKHVPMMEENAVAAIENNVFGTKNLIDASLESSVQKFVLISTDKAVAPVSVYGVSKLICEKLVLEAAKKASQKEDELDKKKQAFMFVRFGNVLGSRGSILPIFMEQIQNGGPVTVTDPDMERYFMTIPEACSLVLQAGGVGKNGESYLLDMGEPIKIIELAKQAIKFSGFIPDTEIKIKIIGSRKGERLSEPLWLEEEKPEATEYKKILRLNNSLASCFDLSSILNFLKPICFLTEGKEEIYRDSDELKKILRKTFPSLDEFYSAEEAEKENGKKEASVL